MSGGFRIVSDTLVLKSFTTVAYIKQYIIHKAVYWRQSVQINFSILMNIHQNQTTYTP